MYRRVRNFIGDREDTVILAVGGGSCIDLAKVCEVCGDGKRSRFITPCVLICTLKSRLPPCVPVSTHQHQPQQYHQQNR